MAGEQEVVDDRSDGLGVSELGGETENGFFWPMLCRMEMAC
jgi:hypothetical protein